MSLRIKICRDVWGTWSVHGPSSMPVSHLPSLSASIDYARKQCDAPPATIELYVDGVYNVAHQERGWPKALAAPAIGQSRPASTGPHLGTAPLRSRLGAWLRRARHLNTEPSLASVRQRQGSNGASLKLV
jgi:hypothetical protein